MFVVPTQLQPQFLVQRDELQKDWHAAQDFVLHRSDQPFDHCDFLTTVVGRVNSVSTFPDGPRTGDSLSIEKRTAPPTKTLDGHGALLWRTANDCLAQRRGAWSGRLPVATSCVVVSADGLRIS
jgi:hypothetical protein